MTFSFRPAVRENVPLLIGLAGGTGSGKTWSAMTLATGLANGKKFAVVDTENGRARHYADQFEFDCADLTAPFNPAAYTEAIVAADTAGYPVVIVDSASHEHAGEGGLLDMHEVEFQRMGGRDSAKMAAWIKPKMEHKAMVSKLLQVRAHVILCFRAQQSIEIVKDEQGKMQVVPKRTLTGLDGWVPICEKTLPYELTLSFLLTADAPGMPKPIKLQEQHRAFVPLDRPLSEETGRLLGVWARGGAVSEAGNGKKASPGDEEVPQDRGTSALVSPSPAASETAFATEAQRRKIFKTAKEHGVEEDRLRTIVESATGQTSTAQIPKGKVDEILGEIAAQAVAS